MLLIEHGTVITRTAALPLLFDGAVAIEGDRIAALGSTADLRRQFPQARLLDARQQLVMPGLINTHMHGYSTLARGMALKSAPPANFRDILEGLWWRLDRTLAREDVYYSALVALIDCIHQGTTTVFDHHASAHCVSGSLSEIARASQAAGIRACLCYEVSDRDGPAIMAEGIRENLDWIGYCQQQPDPMRKAMFGLHASFTLSDQTLAACVAARGDHDVGFHIHAAEAPEDRDDARQQYGLGVIERLAAARILGPKTIAAHCVHISPAEIEILRATQTMVVHNPQSNMGNAVGYPPVAGMLARDVVVGLGTDGYTCDQFESLKFASCLFKHENHDPSAGWSEAPAMLFAQNSTIAARYFDQPLGRLDPGAYADVIIVEYDPPTRLQADNIDSHLLFGVSGRSVLTTIIGGRIVMENRRLTTIDEPGIRARSRELAARIWERF